MFRINVTEDTESTERLFSGRSLEVGRSRRCDLVFRDATLLSRRHCRIELVDGHCEVIDLSSRNGLQINGIFFKRGIVEVGDEITLGDLRLELVEFGPDEELPEQIRPCLVCGYLMSVDSRSCPRCADGANMLPKRSTIQRDHIPGYELKRKLGAGGMGIVFEAVRLEDNATTAIKILRPHLARDPSYLVRFVEETLVLTLLQHPNIVQIYGRGSENGLTYIDMELVRGDAVRTRIRLQGPIEERRALKLVWELVLALEFAAQQKIIHGDVKPSNFLLDGHGAVKLCDFGLARFLDFSSASLPGFAAESSGRKGTAAYAAPERFLGGLRPTIPGDIYSMGVSLFQMLTARLPFGNNSEARRNLLRETIPDPRQYVDDIRPATCMLIERMIRNDPSERYQTYRQLQDDLALLLT